MPLIKHQSIQDLKARVSIVDVVAGVVALKRMGTRFKGLCPFHNEKTPSFHVSPDRGIYKCFGCGKAGDIVSFVMETERLAFTEAVETLARRFNIVLEYSEGGSTPEERSLRQEIFEIHETAMEHFHQQLHASDACGQTLRSYWKERRHFSLELADEFRIGAADAAGSALGAALMRKRFSEAAFRECGLFFVRDGAFSVGALRPRFRGRLMIPIRDIQGRVVAFTARQTDLTPKDDPSHEAKYVNSPETPIFTKGELLFNLDRARKHCSDSPFIMVEGQLDALRCWSCGLKSVVAPQGTAITETQLTLLRRLNARLECFLDGDSAGQKAAMRLAPLALRCGIEVTFLRLAAGEDPDALFRDKGLPAYEALRSNAESSIQFICRTLLPDPHSANADEKRRAAESLYDILSNSDSAVVQSALIEEAAQLFNTSASAQMRDFEVFIARSRARAGRFSAETKPPENTAQSGSVSPEEDLLLVLLNYENLTAQIAAHAHHEWIDTSNAAGRLLNRIVAEHEAGTWEGRSQLESLIEDEAERTFISHLQFEEPNLEDPYKIANQALQKMHLRYRETKLRQIGLEIAAEPPDSAQSMALLRKQADLKRQLLHPPRISSSH